MLGSTQGSSGSVWVTKKGSESSLAGCEGYCEAFGFHINEKEAAGSFEQGRDRLQFVF